MILQALKEYYDRKAADPDSGIAPEGFENKAVPYVIVLDKSGNLVTIEFTGDEDTYKKGRIFTVPMWMQKSGKDSWKTTNFFWDHYGYVLGLPKTNSLKDLEQANNQLKTFKLMVSKAKECLPFNETIAAINAFYSNGGLDQARSHENIEKIKGILGCNLSFRVLPNTYLAAQDPDLLGIADKWSGQGFKSDEPLHLDKTGICLVTGQYSKIVRLHRPISGINKKPSPMLAVNNIESPAFASFNKEQGANFPVGEEASFRYATALNYLLRKGSNQKILMGDIAIVFWSAKPTELETNFSLLFDEGPKNDDPDQLTNAVKSLYCSLKTGVFPSEMANTPFFVLGLSPNAARISVRFWHAGSVAEISSRIAQHFSDLEITHHLVAGGSLPIKFLLRAIAPLNEVDRVPPNLVGDWVRSIILGVPYPETLLLLALRKIRTHIRESENKRSRESEVIYPCVAVIKAHLNRANRFYCKTEKEITVSLDETNMSPGYRLGRLFATLEIIQEKAAGKDINATIRDRYYSAASSTPASVMPILMRLKNHHLGKLDKGISIWFECRLAEILAEVSDFPNQLNLQEQGRFAIGYYHQRQAFFTKSQTTEQGA